MNLLQEILLVHKKKFVNIFHNYIKKDINFKHKIHKNIQIFLNNIFLQNHLMVFIEDLDHVD